MSDICIISDGKPGHLNQSLGLVEALLSVDTSLTYDICPPASWVHLIKLLISHLFLQSQPTTTKIFVGAGHRTHLTLLVYKKCFGVKSGAKVIVLMKPSFPLRWFDLCLIPEHDQPAVLPNVIETWGALNRVLPGVKTHNSGLILIGGPSKHFHWDEPLVLSQLREIVEQSAEVAWTLTTSRRTPDSFLMQLSATNLPIEIVSDEQTDKDWLPEQLAGAEICWVTEDSVSMVYEALTAGCRVGLIALQSEREGRISRGLSRLRAAGRVRTLKQPMLSTEAPPVLAESKRCADLIRARGWL